MKPEFKDYRWRYLEQLAKEYPTRYAAFTEIINLQAILNLPKGTEHFISDVHGEYEAFLHIVNNCSGVIREKVDQIFSEMRAEERGDLCTLIYYPHEKQAQLRRQGLDTDAWYKRTLYELIKLTKFLSSRYTRSKVRKAIPRDFNYIIDELLHAQADEDNNRQRYHERIISSIIETGSAHHFVTALAALIKRLAVDHLHLVGDVFDRGAHPDDIMDLLMQYPSLDIEWGNHDMLWMGAACGSEVCIATVVRNNVNYNNFELLENGYGISMRSLVLFADKYYKDEEQCSALYKAVSVLVFKLQGAVIKRNPDFDMQDRLFLDKIDYDAGTVHIDGKDYALTTKDFPTIDRSDPYRLNQDEEALIVSLKQAFLNSKRLQTHIAFLFAHGSMYKIMNGNLLYHGCIPLTADGSFAKIFCDGAFVQGREYFDAAERVARRGFDQRDQRSLDHMWYLWCGKKSPLSGRVIKTFERAFVADKAMHEEPRDPYYTFYHQEEICRMILREFSLDEDKGHIINGHTPIKASSGENPVRGGGRLLVIDGGFCQAYHRTTGIAGYTLIFNSHGLRLKAHRPFQGIAVALKENQDITSESIEVERFAKRWMVADCDNGQEIKMQIESLKDLLQQYRQGNLPEKL